MNKYDLIEEYTNLFTSPSSSKKTIELLEDIIAHSCIDTTLKSQSELVLDIGIGTILIQMYDDEILYSFQPSNKLEEKVAEAITNKESPIIKNVGKDLNDLLKNIYLDIL